MWVRFRREECGESGEEVPKVEPVRRPTIPCGAQHRRRSRLSKSSTWHLLDTRRYPLDYSHVCSCSKECCKLDIVGASNVVDIVPSICKSGKALSVAISSNWKSLYFTVPICLASQSIILDSGNSIHCEIENWRCIGLPFSGSTHWRTSNEYEN